MWTWTKSRRSLGLIRPFGRVHLKWLVRGTVATVGLVLLRLALPWPLKGVIELLIPKARHGGASHSSFLPSWGDPVLWFVGLYVLLILGAGILELIQRVCMAKFSTHTVHDLRAAAVRGAARLGAGGGGDPGDLIARIIGDAARIKESVKGILIHASQNGLFYLGVCAVFVFISPQLSLFFLAGGLIAVWVGYRTSSRVASVFKKQRKKEGAFASAIHEGLEHDNLEELDALNQSSANKDVRVTKLITFSSLIVHVSFAATTGLAVWVGTREVAAGMLSAGELFLFITYALTVHHRIVQVGRQLARAGKVVACADRIGSLVDQAAPSTGDSAIRPLSSQVKLEAVGLDAARTGERARVEALDLSLKAGQKVAVLGVSGSGKSSLLRLLAGTETADRGKVLWDEEDVTAAPEKLISRVGYLAQEPVFPPKRLWMLLGLPGPESPAPEAVETLKKTGAWKIVGRMPKGLREKVGSATLSRNEARALRLGALLTGTAAVWVIDSPFEGLGKRRARRSLEELLSRLGSRTLVLSLARPVALDSFDRVIVLREGRIFFDGGPREWKERRLLKK
jgi:ATP-binding cassette, subfamily B, bacterial